MAKDCYVCNKTLDTGRQHFTVTKLAHSKDLISDLLKGFLGNFQSNRNVHDKLNCICEKCYEKIVMYDWFRIQTLKKEMELRTLFMKTEKLFGLAEDNDDAIKIDSKNEGNEECNVGKNNVLYHSKEHDERNDIKIEEEHRIDIGEVELIKSDINPLPDGVKGESDSEEENENRTEAENEFSNEGSDNKSETTETNSNTDGKNVINKKQKSDVAKDSIALTVKRIFSLECDICNDGISYSSDGLKVNTLYLMDQMFFYMY